MGGKYQSILTGAQCTPPKGPLQLQGAQKIVMTSEYLTAVHFYGPLISVGQVGTRHFESDLR